MATTKKPASKLPAQTTRKKRTTKKTSSSRSEAMKSFRVHSPNEPFVSVRITTQTIYWTILLVIVMLISIKILFMQLDILDTLDEINKSILETA